MIILRSTILLVAITMVVACGGGGGSSKSGGAGGSKNAGIANSSTSSLTNDTDGDGYPDNLDAFPKDRLEWLDTDKDGVGDNSDPDIDGDGTSNAQDAFPQNPSEQKDTDLDGIGDNTDPDIDGDGVLNSADLFPNDKSDSLDADSDGIGDNSDPTPLGELMPAWSTYQGNASHSGLISGTLDKKNFNTRWTKNLPINGSFQGAGGDGYLFVNSNGVLHALSTATGDILWTKNVGKSSSPAYENGKVYIEAIINNSAVLLGINAIDGKDLFQSPTSEQLYTYYSPTVVDNVVYVPAGYYQGIRALDADTGQQKWIFNETNVYGTSIPTITSEYVITYSGYYEPKLKVIDRSSGSLTFSIDNPQGNWDYSQNSNQAVVISGDSAVVISNGRMANFNLASKSRSWEVTGQYYGQPVIKEGKIYAFNAFALEVRDLMSGDLLNNVKSPYGFSGNIIVSDNLLFAFDGNNTSAYKLGSLEKVWGLSNKSGVMVAADDALFIATNSGIIAVNLKGDIDADNLPDWWEKSLGKNIDSSKDQDNDGLVGLQEFLNNTNPIVADTDKDGLSDGDELNTYFTSPLLFDSDKDGLSDYAEVVIHKTNPKLKDSDSDTLGDAAELTAGLNPLNATDAEKDNDGDGFSNRHEVLANTNPNNASIAPHITDWEMLQGNSKHNSYQPVILNQEAFKLRWIVSLSGQASSAVTGNGKVYLRDMNNIVSLDSGTGQLVWSAPVYGNEISFSEGTVFSYGINYSKGIFAAYDSENGQLKVSTSHDSQYGSYGSPTVYGGQAYIKGGYYGGMFAFDINSGEKKWEVGSPLIEWSDSWQPAVSDSGLFVVAQNKLRSLSRVNGTLLFEIDNPQVLAAQTPIIGSKGNVLTSGLQITSYDILNRKVAWQAQAPYALDYNSLAVGNGNVYAISGNTINVFDETNGDYLWSWSSKGNGFTSNIVITASHLFISDQSTTYAVDLSNHLLIWSYPRGGQHLSVGREGALFVVNNSEIFALEIEGDADKDGIPEWWERKFGGNLSAAADIDNDGLTNLEEFKANTNPSLGDTDGDTLSDSQEVNTLHTNPLQKDSDRDGLADNIEVSLSTSPLLTDSDSDGIDDQTEIQNSLNPTDANDANLDSDNDGFSNKQEIFAGTNPANGSDSPSAHDWAMVQGNASHDGFQPIVLAPENFSLRWRKTFEQNISAASTGDGKIFVTSFTPYGSSNLFAINITNATTEWANNLDGINYYDSVSAPSYDGKKVYTHGVDAQGYALKAFESKTGEQFFRTALSNGGNYYGSPTIFDGNAYLSSSYGGTSAYKLLDGSQLWQLSSTSSYNFLEPAVNNQSVFSVQSNNLVVTNRQTGTEQYRIETPTWSETFVLGKLNDILVVGPNLKSINLTNRETNWTSLQANISGLPAVGNRSVYFISNGTLYSLDELTGKLQWSWAPSSSDLSSNIVVTLSHVFVSTSNKTYAVDVSSGFSVWSFDAGGKLSLGREGALHIVSGKNLYTINITGDKDEDQIPDWWEDFYGLDKSNNTDAVQDTDADGVSNKDEFEFKSNPTLTDSDGDSLTDFAEIRTHHTSPYLADTDADKLSDSDELTTYSTDPVSIDTDKDDFTDGEEVLVYLTNPNDPASKPAVISNYTQSFEATPLGWTQPAGSNSAWVIDNTTGSNGAQSLRAGPISTNQQSDVEFGGFFAAGVLTFDFKLPNTTCCTYMQVYLDDELVLISGSTFSWNSYSINLTRGEHKIRWSYISEYTDPSGDNEGAWIDNITVHP